MEALVWQFGTIEGCLEGGQNVPRV
jgi:hypothetical protein